LQWRSKALRGPGSTVTWGPYPSPLHPFPSPTLPPPLEVGPFNPVRGLGSAISSPSRVWGGAPAEIAFGAF